MQRTSSRPVLVARSLATAIAACSLMTAPTAAVSPRGGFLYEVTSLADNTTTNGRCTLREAINSANGAVSDCGPGSPGVDAIVFAVDGTIILDSQLPNITTDVFIDGSGHSVAVSGGAITAMRVLSGTTNLKKLTIANTLVGLENHATVVISEVVFANLTGIAVYNAGTTTVNVGTFTGNGGELTDEGGAILNDGGTLTVRRSTFQQNRALDQDGRGGAIFSDGGSVSVDKSTFSRNEATSLGGAISSSFTDVEVTNSTFSANTAPDGGAIHTASSLVDVTNATLARNIGSTASAISGNGTLATLRNVVILGRTGITCLHAGSGGITDGGGNVAWPDQTCPGLHADPRLDVLRDNGGLTKTVGLRFGSPAIDRGDPTTCGIAPVADRDQRGGTRPVNGDGTGSARCDSGSTEYGAIKPPRPLLVSNTNVGGGERLIWERARDALRYVVEVRKGGSLVASRTTTVDRVTIPLGAGTFRWTVQACNDHGCTRSTARTFTR